MSTQNSFMKLLGASTEFAYVFYGCALEVSSSSKTMLCAQLTA